jgi:guanylate kinase
MLARIKARGQDDEREIARRLVTAEAELKEAPRFDYIIESRTRDEDFSALLEIVKQARQKAATFTA